MSSSITSNNSDLDKPGRNKSRLGRRVRALAAALMAIIVGLGSVLVGANPAAAAEDGTFVYQIELRGARITGCVDGICPTDMTIPATIGEGPGAQPVIAIAGGGAFAGQGITKLRFAPDSQLETIGARAFEGNAIKSLVLPSSVYAIASNAFAFNKIASLEIPPSVTSVGPEAFMSNQITDLSISPDSELTAIDTSAFRSNDIRSLTVPASVTIIGDYAFAGNESLDDVRFYGTKPNNFGTGVFENTGEQPIYYRAGISGWNGTTKLSERDVTSVAEPVIITQPESGTVPTGGEWEVSVEAQSDIPGQGALSYQWLRNSIEIEGATESAFAATTAGVYKVRVSSWVGSITSATATLVAPTPEPTPEPTPPTPAPPAPAPPAPASVVKKRQSVKVKLPAKLKRNKAYKLPAKTAQGVALSYKVKGPGKCKINKKKRTITCKRATAKKYLRLTVAAKATTTLHPYKTTIKRRVR